MAMPTSMYGEAPSSTHTSSPAGTTGCDARGGVHGTPVLPMASTHMRPPSYMTRISGIVESSMRRSEAGTSSLTHCPAGGRAPMSTHPFDTSPNLLPPAPPQARGQTGGGSEEHTLELPARG